MAATLMDAAPTLNLVVRMDPDRPQIAHNGDVWVDSATLNVWVYVGYHWRHFGTPDAINGTLTGYIQIPNHIRYVHAPLPHDIDYLISGIVTRTDTIYPDTDLGVPQHVDILVGTWPTWTAFSYQVLQDSPCLYIDPANSIVIVDLANSRATYEVLDNQQFRSQIICKLIDVVNK